jgi:Ni2+-binding GTPase involved in maturation of urease and hydrogenase
MQFHLVGGFLGSGKTTAIIQAARLLVVRGGRVGIVTNDQGKYLVDTAFFRAEHFPTVEVTGGCFCCNFNDLEARLKQLQQDIWPDVIFAETVGSCTDVVATVVKPLLDLHTAGVQLTSYTVLTDIRLLRRRLNQQPMPFGDDVLYIFDKQIEETGLLILNKADMLTPTEAAVTLNKVHAAYPGKPMRLQNSRDEGSVGQWLALISTGAVFAPGSTVDIDYDRYGAGEADMAWLDETLRVTAPPNHLRETVVALISSVKNTIHMQGWPVGHVKFMIRTAEQTAKVSLPSIEEPNWETQVPEMRGDYADVLINARVQAPSESLRSVVHSAIHEACSQAGASFVEQDVAAFHPNFPRPTHRYR